MEIFSLDDASFILDVQPTFLKTLARRGDIGQIGDSPRLEFAWAHLERFLEKEDELSIFAAQRQIADAVWPD